MRGLLNSVLLIGLVLPGLLWAVEPKPFVSGSMVEITSRLTDKPMIVSFWSIDCRPCLKELPMWRALSAEYPDIDLILISTDALGVEGEVSQVLQQNGLSHLELWQFAEPHTQRLRYEVDKVWYGELPRTYFFSALGESSARSGVIEYKEIVQWLAQH